MPRSAERILVEPAAEALVGDVDRAGSGRARRPRARPRATGPRSRSAPVGLWQQPWSSATSPGCAARRAPRSCPRSGSSPARARNRDIRPISSPTARMIGGWLGQVGVPTNTRASGLAVAISSKPSRSAPQPPGVCKPGDPLVVGMLAEQDRPQQLGEALVAGAAEIGLGLLRIEQPLLGFLHHLEDRRVAGAVAEHADADVDLVRPRIGVARGRSAQAANRSRRAEDRRVPLPSRRFGQHGMAISEVQAS